MSWSAGIGGVKLRRCFDFPVNSRWSSETRVEICLAHMEGNHQWPLRSRLAWKRRCGVRGPFFRNDGRRNIVGEGKFKWRRSNTQYIKWLVLLFLSTLYMHIHVAGDEGKYVHKCNIWKYTILQLCEMFAKSSTTVCCRTHGSSLLLQVGNFFFFFF